MQICTVADLFGPFLHASSASGYLDPGTGSYALQLLLAGAFGGLFALKQSWRQVRARIAEIRSGRRGASPACETTD